MFTMRIPCSDAPKDSAASTGPQTLDVRHRVVLCGDSAEQRHATVGCPERGYSIPLAECMQCDRCCGLFHDANLGRSRVMCGSASNKPAASPAVPSRGWQADNDPAMRTPVSAIMARDVVCVRPDLSVEALISLLLERSISGVPVVDASGRPIGVVSKTDVVRTAQDQGDTSEFDKRASPSADIGDMGRGFHECELAQATVEEIMTPISFSLPENATIAQAAALMAYEGVHRLPVVGASQEVVGLVSSLDVLRWIARRSGYVVPQSTRQQRA